VLQDGQWARGRLTLPGGLTRLVLVGRHDLEGGGVVTLRVGERSLETIWPLKERALALGPLELPGGRQTLEVWWRACSGRDCGLLLDRIEAERAP
jgi:hypothetical protein